MCCDLKEQCVTDKASGGSVLQIIVLSEQGHDLGEDGLAHQLALMVFGHDAWTHLQLLAHLPMETQQGVQVTEHV